VGDVAHPRAAVLTADAPAVPFVDAFEPAQDLMRQRWRGQPGRVEVWYTTLTDPRTGTGLWLHHELVAPRDGSTAHTHGWIAVFPPTGPPRLARFGPYPWTVPVAHPGCAAPPVFAAGPVGVASRRLWGSADDVAWDLRVDGGGAPLYPFPRWAWRRELLPAAQVVALPTARLSGTVRIGQSTLDLIDAPGATARVYGHGNAHEWAWLHADLGGGDVCEVVTAVANRPGMRRLRPVSFVALRVGGIDLPPGDPVRNAARFHADIDLPTWTVTGRFGAWRVAVEVTQPPAATIAVDYRDPDGAPSVCHNSARADATVTVEERRDGRWRERRSWQLTGTAHAEVGRR
jgi:hypothetical protein